MSINRAKFLLGSWKIEFGFVGDIGIVNNGHSMHSLSNFDLSVSYISHYSTREANITWRKPNITA